MESREVLSLVEEQRPDLLLLDIIMPHVSGLDILRTLRADSRWVNLPVVILTAANDQATKRRLQFSASDFLSKPVDPIELMPRIRNVVLVKKHFDYLQQHANELEEQVLERTAELAQSRREITQCLARAAEYRDNDTGKHVVRVGRYTRLIAQSLGIDPEYLDIFEQAAQLHDIGKIAVPDSILLKRDKLTPEEFEIVSRHTTVGQQILEKLPDEELKEFRDHTTRGASLLKQSESPILLLASKISLSHHEAWDGTGYPNHLAGEAIPLEGRIVAVADVFDALSSERPYKRAFPIEECFQIIEESRGTQFDPAVLDAFNRCRQDILFTYVQYADLN